MSAALAATGLSAGYGSVRVVRDVELRVDPGRIVSVIGPNGAGKSTLLLALAGALSGTTGTVELEGAPLTGSVHRRARAGLALVPEERSVIGSLTTRDNLLLGRVDPDEVFALFPELAAHAERSAGLLSGGQQQMLTLGRAMARRPKVLLVDELTLGRAPVIATRLFAVLRTAAEQGVGVLMVEQHARAALRQADHAYVMRRGVIELSGPGIELLERLPEIERAYLGGVDAAVDDEERTDTCASS